jgi:hypothetical protein
MLGRGGSVRVGFGGDLEVIRTTRAVWRHCEFARAVEMDAERYTEQQQGEVVMRSGDRGR